MPRRAAPLVAGALVAFLALAAHARPPVGAQSTPRATNPATSNVDKEPLPRIEVRLTPVARVTGGTALAFRRHDPTLYLARQRGLVVPIVDGRVGRPILDVRDRVGDHREQGLLGLAFSPDGRRLYTYLTTPGNENVVEEYRVTRRRSPPVTLDPGSRRTLLTIPHEHPQHNGGHLAFGPDGMLYIAVGDGGGHRGTGPGQVPGGNSQSLDNLLGKILRIDPTPRPASDATSRPTGSGEHPYTVPVDNPFTDGPAPEIWHYGLRNPWRFSFDRRTGDVWIGDVGQDHWEEINVLAAGRAGANFGYPLLEGTHPLTAADAPGTVLPIFELWHRAGNCAVTGGYVYRGRAIPALRGHYVFADYCRGSIKALRQRGGTTVAFGALGLTVPLVSSFAEDPRGELYVVSQSDGVLRLDPG